MLKIRLTRIGKKHQPRYRLVVAEHTSPAKGKFIEKIGSYNPVNKKLMANKEKIEEWLKNGAKPSNTASKLLKKLGLKHPSIVIQEFHKKSKTKDKKEKTQENKIEEKKEENDSETKNEVIEKTE